MGKQKGEFPARSRSQLESYGIDRTNGFTGNTRRLTRRDKTRQ